MHIYDNRDPLSAKWLSTYSHITACDPVVVRGNYAYVTLRNGSECNTFANQLEIADISDLTNPKLAAKHIILNPHGLGINGSCLFICEGRYGLKAFELSPNVPTEIALIEWFKDTHAFDVITLANILMMVGEDGFYQYEYSCGERLEYLSKIGFQGQF